ALPVARATLDRAVVAGLEPTTADRYRRQFGLTRPTDSAPRAAQPEIVPADADCVRMHTLFAGREDVHARQWARQGGETGYSPVHEPLTPAVIRSHLQGNHTVGVYVLRLDATATFFALDLDLDKQALQKARGNPEYAQQLRDALRAEGLRLLVALRELGFQPLFENSGYKGRHLWVFLEQPVAGEVLLQLGRRLLALLAPLGGSGLHLEFFPKQATLKGQGLGNLIKLPLGIHRRTGYRSLLLDDAGEPAPNQLEMLRHAPRCPQSVLYAAIESLRDVPERVVGGGDDSSVGESRAKSSGSDKLGVTGGMIPAPKVSAPKPPALPPVWTEADFEADPRVRHLLAECPVLAELKQMVDQHRQLGHEEQLVLIHSLGHLEGGPQAVNHMFAKCLDVGPEKFMKDRLKGSPVSCPSIRKKIPHVTRRVACNCPFEFAADRYPTPVLHLLTLPADQSLPAPVPRSDDLASLARRFGVLERRKAEVIAEWQELRRLLVEAIARHPDRQLACDGGTYRVESRDGVDELIWTEVACTPSS
ncbi:MAG: CRISPR-associated primase-polymerase type A1, partial [Planctomycetota bacterium]|nr:CRISPR-associated primase-polymerase type A1 [Planctomycetota bacterium]